MIFALNRSFAEWGNISGDSVVAMGASLFLDEKREVPLVDCMAYALLAIKC